jgi:hypothetical protein
MDLYKVEPDRSVGQGGAFAPLPWPAKTGKNGMFLDFFDKNSSFFVVF